MILLGRSKAREGFVRVREWRAELTRWVGSEKKCFAGIELVVLQWSWEECLFGTYSAFSMVVRGFLCLLDYPFPSLINWRW